MAIKNYVVKNKRKTTCILSVILCLAIALSVFVQTNNTNAGVFIKDGDKNVQIYEINILEIVAIEGQQVLGYTVKGQEPISKKDIEAYTGFLDDTDIGELENITGNDIERKEVSTNKWSYTVDETDFNQSFNKNVLGDSMANGEIKVKVVPANELTKEDVEWARLIYINSGDTCQNLPYYYDQIVCGGEKGYVKNDPSLNKTYKDTTIGYTLRKDVAEKKISQSAGNVTLAEQLTEEDFISLNLTISKNDAAYINVVDSAIAKYIEAIKVAESGSFSGDSEATTREKIAAFIDTTNLNIQNEAFEVIKSMVGVDASSADFNKDAFIEALNVGGYEGYNEANIDSYCEAMKEDCEASVSGINEMIENVNNANGKIALDAFVSLYKKYKGKNYDKVSESDKALITKYFMTANVGDVKEAFMEEYIKSFIDKNFKYNNSNSSKILDLINDVNTSEYDKLTTELVNAFENNSIDSFIENANMNFELLNIEDYYSCLLDEYVARMNEVVGNDEISITDVATFKTNVIDVVNGSMAIDEVSCDMTWEVANHIYTSAMNEEVALMYNSEMLRDWEYNSIASPEANKINTYKMLLISRLLQYDYYKDNYQDKIDSNGTYYPYGYDANTGMFIGDGVSAWTVGMFGNDINNYAKFREPAVLGQTYGVDGTQGAYQNYVYKRIYSFSGDQFLSGKNFKDTGNFTSLSTGSNSEVLAPDNLLVENRTLFESKTKGYVIRYILGVSLMEVRIPIKVLEIQPTAHSSKFNNLKGAKLLYQYLGLNPDEVDENNWSEYISVTPVSVREFNTRNEDLTANYDLIYIGAENTAFYQKGLKTSNNETIYRTDFIDDSLDGKVYYGIGDTINVASKLGGIAAADYDSTTSGLHNVQIFDDKLWKEYFFDALEDDGLDRNTKYLLKNPKDGITTRLLGNDITVKRMEELLSYLKAGYPVMLADEIFYCDNKDIYNEPTYGTSTDKKHRIYYKAALRDDNKIYFKNDDNWSDPRAYIWNGDTHYNGDWPGKTMTNIGGGWYSFDCSGVNPSNTKVIFSNNGSNKTGDLDLVVGAEYNNGGVRDFIGDLHIYLFKEGTSEEYAGGWPGTKMEYAGNGLFYYDYDETLSESSTKVIFTGTGKDQTGNLKFKKYGLYQYRDNTTKEYTPDPNRDYEKPGTNVERWTYVDKNSKLYNFVVEAKKLGYDEVKKDYTGLVTVEENGSYVTKKVFEDNKVYPSLVREGNRNFKDYSLATSGYSAEEGGNPDNLEGFDRLEGGLRFAYKRIDYVNFEYDDTYELRPREYEEINSDSYIKNTETKYSIKLNINSSVTVEEMESKYAYKLYLDKSGVGKFDDRYTLELEPKFTYDVDDYGNVTSVVLSGNWPKKMEGFMPWKIEAYKKANPEVKFSHQSYSVFENEEPEKKKDVYVLWVRTQFPYWWGRTYGDTSLEFASAVNKYASKILDYNIHIFTISYYDFNRLYGMHDGYYEDDTTTTDDFYSMEFSKDEINNGTTKLKLSTLITEYYAKRKNKDNNDNEETNTYQITLPSQLDDYKDSKDEVKTYFYGGEDPKMTEDEYNSKELDMLVLGFSDSYDLSQHSDGQGYNNYRKYLDVRSVYALRDIEYFLDAGHSLLYAHDNSSAVSTMMDYFKAGTTDRAMGWAKYNTMFLRERLGQDTYGVTLDKDLRTESANNARKYIDTNKLNNSDLRGFTEITTFKYQEDIGRTYSVYGSGANLDSYYNVNPISAGDNDESNSWRYTKTARKVNVGQITEYPFIIPNKIDVAVTHSQYNTLDLEDEDTTVWYTLDYNSSSGDAKNNSKLYDFTTGDGANNYYIYTNGNITYTGAGHEAIGETGDEIELFINTLIAALKAGNYQPEVELPNAYEDDNGINCIDYDTASEKAKVDFIPIDYDYRDGYNAFSDCKIYVDINGDNAYTEKVDILLNNPSNSYITDGNNNKINIIGTDLLNRQTRTFYLEEDYIDDINDLINDSSKDIYDYMIVVEVVDNGNSVGANKYTARNSFKLVETTKLNIEDFNLN